MEPKKEEISENKKPKMLYKYLGNSGLKVSRLSYGNWLNSNDPDA